MEVTHFLFCDLSLGFGDNKEGLREGFWMEFLRKIYKDFRIKNERVFVKTRSGER
jgi:hypothetical protein